MTTGNVQQHKALLEKQLWAVADELRGQMNPEEYQRYTLGLIFYKYLSEKTERKAAELLENDDMTFEQAWADDQYQPVLQQSLTKALGFAIAPENLYSSLVYEISQGEKGDWSTDRLQTAFTHLVSSTIGEKSQSDFEGLFDDINLTSPNLGTTPERRNIKLGTVLQKIGQIDFQLEDTEIDVLGDAYEYLIGQFASDAGKKGGEFYTPQTVSQLVANILSHEVPHMKSIYDPTCGSGSLLLRVARETPVERRAEIMIYGQELNTTTYNLARMNMILHGVPVDNFNIRNGDTLENDMLKDVLVDASGANPPYSAKWTHTSGLEKDPRYAPYGKLAPQDKADYAFIVNIISKLKPKGAAAIVLPHGVLFRGGAEGIIRQKLIDNNQLHAVIGLPENLFYGTSIPTCILVFKKDRKPEDKILFIDASNHFDKGKNQNHLSGDHVTKILDTYKKKATVEKYSSFVSLETIQKNDYNLNIPRYVDTFEDEEEIDLEAVTAELAALEAQEAVLTAQINEYISQLHPYTPEVVEGSEEAGDE